jgi:hypothetical protein
VAGAISENHPAVLDQQNWNPIAEQLPVTRNQDQSLDDHLGDKQTIKRVAVVEGEIPDCLSVTNGYR